MGVEHGLSILRATGCRVGQHVWARATTSPSITITLLAGVETRHATGPSSPAPNDGCQCGLVHWADAPDA